MTTPTQMFFTGIVIGIAVGIPLGSVLLMWAYGIVERSERKVIDRLTIQFSELPRK